MTDPTDPSTFTLVQSVPPTFNLYGNEPIVVTFDTYTGGGNYIAMRNTVVGSAYSRISVDDVTLETIPSCPPPTAVTITNITDNSATISWTENGDATTWNLEYTPVGGTPVVIPVTTNPYTLTNLASTTTFNVRVQATCSAAETSTWSGTNSFATNMVAASLPYSTDFSANGDTQWFLNNGTAPNRWMIGSYDGNDALFISNDGTTAGYNVSASSTVMAEKLFTMPADATVHVEFDLTVGGESGAYTPYDFLKVFLTSGAETFTAGTNTITQSAYDYSTNAMNFSTYTGLGTSAFPFIAALSNGTSIHISADMVNPNPNGEAKIVFLWRNDFMEGSQPGAVIKNFIIGDMPVVTDPTVATNAASAVGQTTATLNATITNPDSVTITAKGFQWKATTGGTYTSIAGTGTGNTFTADLTNLTPNTSYTFKAFITYNGTTVEGSEMTFTTQGGDTPEPCDVPTGLHTTDIQNESIAIAWDANPNVNSWNVQYRLENGSWNSATSTTNSYTITGLTGDKDYEIQVQAVCADGTSDWSASITAHTTNVGIENWLENNVTLFPNPAKEYVDIRVDGDLNVTAMEVYDVYGKLINTVNVIDNPTRINVNGLADGMYFVRVTTEQGVVTKSFLKK